MQRAQQQLKAIDSAVQEVLEVLQPGPTKASIRLGIAVSLLTALLISSENPE